MRKVTPRFKQPQRRRIFVRQWREFRHMTQQALADRIGVTHGAISQLERGLMNYTQPMLEALAEALNCEPADLIMRNPTDADSPWSIWETLEPEQRQQAIRIIKALKEDAA